MAPGSSKRTRKENKYQRKNINSEARAEWRLLKRTVILINCVPFRNRDVLNEISRSLLELYSAPVSKFRYFEKYIIHLYGYIYVHVSGQRQTDLER